MALYLFSDDEYDETFQWVTSHLKQISKEEQVTCKMFYTDYACINCKTDM